MGCSHCNKWDAWRKNTGHHTDRDQEGKLNEKLCIAHLTGTASWARNNSYSSRWGETRSGSGFTTVVLRHSGPSSCAQQGVASWFRSGPESRVSIHLTLSPWEACAHHSGEGRRANEAKFSSKIIEMLCTVTTPHLAPPGKARDRGGTPGSTLILEFCFRTRQMALRSSSSLPPKAHAISPPGNCIFRTFGKCPIAISTSSGS